MSKYLLSSMPIGLDAVIDSLSSSGTQRRRLLDLGFTPGTHISCLYEAPSGDPRAYLVRGTIIALRAQDAVGVSLI